MKKSILNLPIMLLVAISLLMFNSCKKAETDDSGSAQDTNAVNSALNATADDATVASGQVHGISGKTDGLLANLCGATTVDTGTAHTITITYDGTTTCSGITRSGTVTIALVSGTHWKDQGAQISITFNNLVVTDVLTAGHFTLNGTHTITNETGSLAWDVLVNGASGPVAHRHTGSLDITYANSTHRTWTIDRTRTFTKNSAGYANIQLSSEASGNVDATGTNSQGNTFTNSIPTPIQSENKPGCVWKPYAGQYIHQVNNKTVTTLFGTNASGQSMGSAGTCADGYYITYQVGNRTKTKFVAYW